MKPSTVNASRAQHVGDEHFGGVVGVQRGLKGQSGVGNSERVGDHLSERNCIAVASEQRERASIRLQILASDAHHVQAPPADHGGVELLGAHIDESSDLDYRPSVADHRRG